MARRNKKKSQKRSANASSRPRGSDGKFLKASGAVSQSGSLPVVQPVEARPVSSVPREGVNAPQGNDVSNKQSEIPYGLLPKAFKRYGFDE